MSGRRRSARPATRLSQHYLRSDRLARRLIALTGVARGDLIVEAGPGRGALTRALAARGCRVVAVEIDRGLAAALRHEFSLSRSVEVFAGDFLRFPLPLHPYKFISNVPFAHTADIVRRVALGSRPPTEAWMIVQREAAARFAGYPYGPETLLSLTLKPAWHVEVTAWLSPVHFDPPPSVDAVFMRMTRRDPPLLASAERRQFLAMVRTAFRHGGPEQRRLSVEGLTGPQLRRLAGDLGFGAAQRPSDLSLDQWLAVFRFRAWSRA